MGGKPQRRTSGTGPRRISRRRSPSIPRVCWLASESPDPGQGRTRGSCLCHRCGQVYGWGETRPANRGWHHNEPTRPIAVDAVPGGQDGDTVAAGGEHTCVLADGTPYRWGENSDDNPATAPPSIEAPPPRQHVRGARGQTDHDHHRGRRPPVLADGRPYCWGGNPRDRSATATTIDRSNPGPVWSASGGIAGKAVTALDAGVLHTCVVADGQHSAGDETPDGALGDGTNTNRTIPVPVNTSGLSRPER